MTPPEPGTARVSLPTLLLLLACTACGADAPAADGPADGASPPDVGIVDAAGRTHGSDDPPRRIVSLVPSATGTLRALGAGDRLVGRTQFDTAEDIAHLPSVGPGLRPNIESLLALEPDLVIRFAGPSDPDTPERLDRAGIRHFAVRPDGVADVREMVRELGALVGRAVEADSLVAKLDAGLADVRERVAGREPVRVAYILGGSPPWVAGPGTFIDELLETAGGLNVFDDLGDLYAPVSVEALLARDVDLFVVAPGAEVDRRVRDRAPTRAAPPGLETPGPDLAASAAVLARLLHPGAWP